ncbi:MAG: hypothetical protein QOK16_3897 [Solirubrobacteraceae bacterium]|nr:hypothetical protein [Solirubrobacteraceae bacterium]
MWCPTCQRAHHRRPTALGTQRGGVPRRGTLHAAKPGPRANGSSRNTFGLRSRRRRASVVTSHTRARARVRQEASDVCWECSWTGSRRLRSERSRSAWPRGSASASRCCSARPVTPRAVAGSPRVPRHTRSCGSTQRRPSRVMRASRSSAYVRKPSGSHRLPGIALGAFGSTASGAPGSLPPLAGRPPPRAGAHAATPRAGPQSSRGRRGASWLRRPRLRHLLLRRPRSPSPRRASRSTPRSDPVAVRYKTG